jgi:hypothetical protein
LVEDSVKKVYCTFAGAVYDRSVQRIVEDAPRFGADRVLIYDDKWVTEQEFYALNKWLWESHPVKRGFGWWCWKPHIIMDALERSEAGDVVLYTDGDTYPVADLSPLYKIAARDGIMLFEASDWWQRQWCKRDCYIVMGMDDPRYHALRAGVGRFMLFKKGPWLVRQFLMEWQTYLLNPHSNNREPSTYAPELPEFRGHRDDQSVLTLLAAKYGIPLYREACQAGDGHPHDRDLYPTVFRQADDWTGGKDGALVRTAPCEGSRWRNV